MSACTKHGSEIGTLVSDATECPLCVAQRQNVRLIGLGHKKRTGKDTAADGLQRRGFQKISFARRLKKTLGTLLFDDPHDRRVWDDDLRTKPLPEFWGRTPVQLLQQLGTEAVRKGIHPDFWVAVLENHIRKSPGLRFVIDACRFPNEADMVKRLGGIMVKIERPGFEAESDGRSSAHESETALDGYTGWDEVVVNDGTKTELYEKIEKQVLRL